VVNLDRRIAILEPIITVNSYNESVVSYRNYCNVWSAVEDKTGKEGIVSNSVRSEISTRFTVRWSEKLSTIDPRYSITYDDRDYNITVIRRIGRRRWLQIDAIAQAEIGPVTIVTLAIAGEATVTQAADTVAAVGALAIAGEAAATQAADTVVSTALFGSVIEGEATLTQAADTVAAVGALAIAGEATVTQAADTVAAVGALAIAGEAAATQAADTVVSAGEIVGDESLSLTFRTSLTDYAFDNPIVFSDVAIGDASSDRFVVVAIDNNSENEGPTSVSIGGVSATKAAGDASETSPTAQTSIWYANVPTGTTADVSVTCGGQTTYYLACGVYTITGASGISVYESANTEFDGFAGTFTINAPAGAVGVFITAGAAYPAADDTTWTGATKDWYESPGYFCIAGGASLEAETQLTSHDVEVTGGDDDFGWGDCYAIFEPS
jgi:head-tail adaptor